MLTIFLEFGGLKISFKKKLKSEKENFFAKNGSKESFAPMIKQ